MKNKKVEIKVHAQATVKRLNPGFEIHNAGQVVTGRQVEVVKS